MHENNKEIVVIVYNLRSVYNVGSIFRTADAAAVNKIYLVGTSPTPKDRFGRWRKDLAKVALGAEKTLDWEYKEDIQSLISELKDKSFKILALEQDEKSVNYSEGESADKLALIVGNEPDGIEKETLKLADKIIEIPMLGQKESLNVAVAFALALYSLRFSH